MSSLHIRTLGDAPASIWSLNAAQVRDLTASLSPTPGGGAISVFTATLGLALVHKGASISLKRVGEDAERQECLRQVCESIAAALDTLSGLADEDSLAFQDYVTARGLARTTDNEKLLRNAAMETAILRATRIPLLSAKSIAEAMDYAELALKLTDRHLLSDVFGGAILMQASLRAVLLNVDANICLLSDQGLRGGLVAEREELARVSAERGEAVERAYAARTVDYKDFVGVTD